MQVFRVVLVCLQYGRAKPHVPPQECSFGTSVSYYPPLLDVLLPAFDSRLKGGMASTIHRPNRPMTNKMLSNAGLIAGYGHPTTGSRQNPIVYASVVINQQDARQLQTQLDTLASVDVIESVYPMGACGCNRATFYRRADQFARADFCRGFVN